jgi:YHS domain-containing protein
MKRILSFAVSTFLGAAVCLLVQARGFSQPYSIPSTCNPEGQCRPNNLTFGYNDTTWRQWPLQPRPEEKNPLTVGAHPIPPPPGYIEKPLPHAEGLPEKPAIQPGGVLPGTNSHPTGPSILPGNGTLVPTPAGPAGTTPGPSGLTPGPSGLTPGPNGLMPSPNGLMPSPSGVTPSPSGLTPSPNSPTPSGSGALNPVPGRIPSGVPGIGDGIDFGPRPAPLAPSGSGSNSLRPILPKSSEPEVTTPPTTPVPKVRTTPAGDFPTPNSLLPTGPATAPNLKPDVPAPNSGGSLSGRRSGEVAASPTYGPNSAALAVQARNSSAPAVQARNGSALAEQARNSAPMQANWAAALEADVAGSPSRGAGYEQIAAPNVNPPKCSLGGYCPVQLRENARWVSGDPTLQITYEGQLYQFSSEDALQRFKSAPEKYAPVQAGNDVVLAVDEDRSVTGSVKHSAMWHGRIYLFTSSTTLAAFQRNPSRYGGR